MQQSLYISWGRFGPWRLPCGKGTFISYPGDKSMPSSQTIWTCTSDITGEHSHSAHSRGAAWIQVSSRKVLGFDRCCQPLNLQYPSPCLPMSPPASPHSTHPCLPSTSPIPQHTLTCARGYPVAYVQDTYSSVSPFVIAEKSHICSGSTKHPWEGAKRVGEGCLCGPLA